MISNTNLNLYRSFLKVYETKNLNRAASVLGVSREAVRQNVKELGNQLNRPLFTSHRKGVEPTAEADKLYPVIKNAFDAIANAEKDFERIDNTGTIKIALSNMAVFRYIKDFLTDFQIELVKKGDPQAHFVIDAESALKDYDKTIHLFTLNSVFACTDDFLKKYNLKETISKSDLLDLPIILRGETWKEFSKQFKTKPTVTKTVSSDMTHSLVKASVGIGLLPEKSTFDLVEINVRDIIMPSAKIVCAYNGNLSNTARAFIDGLIAFCKS